MQIPILRPTLHENYGNRIKIIVKKVFFLHKIIGYAKRNKSGFRCL